VVGLLFVRVFLAVVLAYGCTEFLLVRLDARRRMMVGEGSPLLVILGANIVSFAILWVSALLSVFLFASDTPLYVPATVICVSAQAVWLSQHLWSYYRDHLRLKYEN
jgi:hypothetical protein